MLTKETLSKLLSHIEEVQALCEEKGYKNLRLFKPKNIRDWHKLNFIATQPEEAKHNLFIVIHLKENMIRLFGTKVLLITDDMLNPQETEDLAKRSIPYDKNHKQKIAEIFNELFLLSEKLEKARSRKHSAGFFDASSEEETEKENERSDIKKSRISKVEELREVVEHTAPGEIRRQKS